MNRLFLFLVAVLCAGDIGLCHADHEGDLQICKDALKGWQQRADRFPVIRATITGKKTYHAEAGQSFDTDSDPPRMSRPYPKTEQVFETNDYFLIDTTSRRIRTNLVRHVCDLETSELTPEPMQYACNMETWSSRDLGVNLGRPGGAQIEYHINGDPKEFFSGDFQTNIAILTSSGHMPINVYEFYDLTEEQFVDRLNLRVLEVRGDTVRLRYDDDATGQKQTTELICDRSRIYRIEEISFWHGDLKLVKTIFSYQEGLDPIQDDLIRMKTEAWSFMTKKLVLTTDSSINMTALKSGAVDESEFEIEPVAGHWVEDMRTGRRYLQSASQLKWYQSYTVWVVFFVLVLAFLGFRRSKLA